MKILIKISVPLLILLTSCNINKDRQIFQKLQGDWTDSFRQTFLFKDTLCNYLYPLGRFTGFKVEEDTIICTAKYPESKRYREIKFNILRLDEDSLDVEYKSPYTKKNEKLSLHKVKNKLGYDIQVDSVIYFPAWNPDVQPTGYIKFLNDSTLMIKDKDGALRIINIRSNSNFTAIHNDFIFLNEKFANIDNKEIEKYNMEHSGYYKYSKPQVCIYVKNRSNNFKKTFKVYNLYKYGCIIEEDGYPIELKIFMSYADNISLFIN